MNTLAQNVKLEYATKQEQVDASVRFVLYDMPEYYTALGNLPARVQAAILVIVADWVGPPAGYHFGVLRAAYRQYSRGTGFIGADELPFATEDMA